MEHAPNEHDHDLVEPEGVNAGSARVGGEHEEGDVRSGGHPQDAPDPQDDAELTGGADATDPAEGADLTGAPGDDERMPGGPHGSSGQDAGLME